MNIKLQSASLEEVDKLFRTGEITKEEAQEYVTAWNKSGKHLTFATIEGGRIINR